MQSNSYIGVCRCLACIVYIQARTLDPLYCCIYNILPRNHHHTVQVARVEVRYLHQCMGGRKNTSSECAICQDDFKRKTRAR